MPKGNFMLNKRFTNRNQKPKTLPTDQQQQQQSSSPGVAAVADSTNDRKGGKKSEKPPKPPAAILTPNNQWAPAVYTAFKILVSLRITSAIWSPISDCDEVYNYWEPLHMLLYGRGFQTWEYSPAYGLRSYGYVLLYYFPAKLFQSILPHTKVTTFYFVRCLVAFASAACDTVLFLALCQRVSNNVGRLYLLMQALGVGAFVASAAFLPSTFAMSCITLMLGLWLLEYRFSAILCVAVGALVGWPFAAILGLPIVLDMLIRRKEVKNFLLYATVAGVTVVALMVGVDSYFYGKLTLAPLNIVLYNVFSGHGPSLYGVEPWSYYVVNSLLNWNLAAVAACFTLPSVAGVVFVYYRQRDPLKFAPILFMQISLWLWLLIFLRQPHKEERFLFPVYSLICISAALTVDSVHRLLAAFCRTILKLRNVNVVGDVAVIGFVILYTLASFSRIMALYRNYYAPFDVYMALNEHSAEIQHSGKIVDNVCVGKEWYRFPSSFFLPDSARLQFIRSEFRGQLPKPYDDRLSLPQITRTIPNHMNDMNLEEPSRYLEDLSKCRYLIDLDSDSDGTELEPNFSRLSDQWNVLNSSKFLLASESSRFFRAFYVPVFGDSYCKFGSYNLLKRKKIDNVKNVEKSSRDV